MFRVAKKQAVIAAGRVDRLTGKQARCDSAKHTSYTVNATSLNGYNSPVSFSASGNPAGVTVSFNPPGVTPTNSSTMNVSTASNTAPGTYALVITGSDGSITHTTNVSLTVNVPTFTVTANAPTSKTVKSGAGTSYGLTLTPLNTFSGQVSLTVTGGPAGFGYTFTPSSPVSIAYPTATSVTMNITTTAATTPAGTYTLTVKGTSGSLNSSTTLTLVVTPAGTITLTPNPTSLTVKRGKSGTDLITVAGAGYFSGSVTLSVSGLPSKVTASFSPNPVTLTANGSVTSSTGSTLTIKVNPSVKTGTSLLTVKGLDSTGTVTNTATINLTVN